MTDLPLQKPGQGRRISYEYALIDGVNDSPAQAAQTGALVGQVKAAKLGNASITYDTSAITAATESWGDLNATQYGQMLATRARLIGMGGSYVI